MKLKIFKLRLILSVVISIILNYLFWFFLPICSIGTENFSCKDLILPFAMMFSYYLGILLLLVIVILIYLIWSLF